jgi:hypothetical protein
MLKNKLAVVATLAGAALVAAGNASAAIDASVSTAFTAVQADATSLSAIVIPIVVAVLGLFITIKLIKKFGNKI